MDSYDVFQRNLDDIFEACDLARNAADAIDSLDEYGDGVPFQSLHIQQCLSEIRRACDILQESAGKLL